MTPLVGGPEPVAVVRMNWGRWLAECPRPGCASAESYGPGLDGERFTCRVEAGGCGLRCRAVWPEALETIERLLLARPVPATRNWEPGETVHDLLAENVMHGILPDGPLILTDNGMRALPK